MIVFVIIFFTSLISTTLSSMSGGGASVINIPILLWLGVPFPMATTAQKISSSFWVLPASYNYLKGRKINWSFLILFSAIGLIGVYAGVQIIMQINQRILEIIIGALILALVIYAYHKKDIGLVEHRVYSKFRRLSAYFFALILGFYESLFGSGNGIIFSIIALKTRGFDFIDALGYYFSVAFPWCAFAAVLLIAKGNLDLNIIIPTVAGSLIGVQVGSRYAKYKGNRFIKLMFVIIGIILGLKLLLGL